MDIRTRSFVYNVAPDCRMRHSHRRRGKTILSFVVQLEIRHPRQREWVAVVRYDTAHGFAHRDRLKPDGSSEKTPLPIEDYRQALNYAEADLKEHWHSYQAQYLKELEHHEE